jgi:hypothetical protein
MSKNSIPTEVYQNSILALSIYNASNETELTLLNVIKQGFIEAIIGGIPGAALRLACIELQMDTSDIGFTRAKIWIQIGANLGDKYCIEVINNGVLTNASLALDMAAFLQEPDPKKREFNSNVVADAEKYTNAINSFKNNPNKTLSSITLGNNIVQLSEVDPNDILKIQDILQPITLTTGDSNDCCSCEIL